MDVAGYLSTHSATRKLRREAAALFYRRHKNPPPGDTCEYGDAIARLYQEHPSKIGIELDHLGDPDFVAVVLINYWMYWREELGKTNHCPVYVKSVLNSLTLGLFIKLRAPLDLEDIYQTTWKPHREGRECRCCQK